MTAPFPSTRWPSAVPATGERLSLLFGAEGPGLSPGTLGAADVQAGIPMRGGVDSLNVGVAAGIAFWVLGRAGRHRD